MINKIKNLIVIVWESIFQKRSEAIKKKIYPS